MKNILLLGGSGFIGKNIIESFKIQTDIKLIVFARSSKELEDHFLPNKNIIFINGSISDYDLITSKILDFNIDTVIHLVSSIIASSSSEEFFEEMNNVIIPTFKLIDFLSDKDIDFIYFSSGGTIYGKSKDVIKESHIKNPINYYGYSKLIIENYIEFKANSSNLNYLILRPSNVYGRFQKYTGIQGFISVAIYKIYNGIPIDIWGDGNTIRDYIDVFDLVLVMRNLLLSAAKKSTYNISTGIGYSLLDIIIIIENIMHKKAIINFQVKRKIDASKIVLDNSKLLDIINHEFIDVNTGINNQINYFKELFKSEI
jgi:UDP-glucose 4-epimerase